MVFLVKSTCEICFGHRLKNRLFYLYFFILLSLSHDAELLAVISAQWNEIISPCLIFFNLPLWPNFG